MCAKMGLCVDTLCPPIRKFAEATNGASYDNPRRSDPFLGPSRRTLFGQMRGCHSEEDVKSADNSSPVINKRKI